MFPPVSSFGTASTDLLDIIRAGDRPFCAAALAPVAQADGGSQLLETVASTPSAPTSPTATVFLAWW